MGTKFLLIRWCPTEDCFHGVTEEGREMLTNLLDQFTANHVDMINPDE